MTSVQDETEADTHAELMESVLASTGRGEDGSKAPRDALDKTKTRIIFKTLRRLIFPAFLVVSLAFNGLLLVSTTVFSAASTVLGAVTGFVHPHTRVNDDLAGLKLELDDQRRINRELRTDAASLGAQVAASRAAEQQAKRVNRELRSQVAASRAAQAEVKDTVLRVTRRVSERSTRAAKRDAAAMAGEAIPVWGVAVIVAATSLEVYDLCQTVIDMNALQALFDPSLAVPEEELTVCSMKVPSRAELWETTSAAPGAAWASVQESIPSIDDISSSEIREMDWSVIGRYVSNSARSIYRDTTGAVDGKWEQLKRWWDE